MQIIVALVVCAVLVYLYIKYFKKLRCGNMLCITGGIKTGKSLLSVRQSVQLVKSQRRKVWIYNNILRYLAYPFYAFKTKGKLKAKRLRPLLYSNIPLGVPFVPVTDKLLKREEKPVPGSVCYICEASLVADSMTYKDALLNEELLLFNKLWGHASKGGYLIYDTQSICDNHYAVKRCLNTYFYIHHNVKGLFFVYLWLREERFSEDGAVSNVYNEDVEDTLKLHIVPKSVFKLYDRYCYSVLTDHLPSKGVSDEVKKPVSLKSDTIVSFKKYQTIFKKEGDLHEK